MQTDAAKLVPLLSQAMHMTPAQVQARMSTQLPAMAAMLQNLPRMQRDFGALLGTMQQNVDIFGQVPRGTSALPAARHDDAGERGQLRAGQQPAGLPAVRGLLHRSGRAARAARRLRPLRRPIDGSTQQNVSKHLGVLLRAGIVGRRKEGNFAYYSIADDGVFALCETVCGSVGQRLELLRGIVAGAVVERVAKA